MPDGLSFNAFVSLFWAKKNATQKRGVKLTKRRESYENKYLFTIHVANINGVAAHLARFNRQLTKEAKIAARCGFYATPLVGFMPLDSSFLLLIRLSQCNYLRSDL
jgi:hypothetical protein